MDIKINATSNFKNILFKNIKNHVERNYLNDENKSINLNQTPQNLNLSQANTMDLLNSHYHDLIVKHDKRCGNKHANRKYGGIRGFLKAKHGFKKVHGKPVETGVPTKMVVTKFGTFKDKNKILTKLNLTPNQLHNADNVGFWMYANNFNERHKFIKMGRAVSNVDEKGADHVHWELVPLGYTPSGRASMGLSNALKDEYDTKDRQKAMKKFHDEEDNKLIICMNKAYQNSISPNIHFTLHRTGKAWGLSEQVFERSKIEEDNINHNLNKSNENLVTSNNQLKKALASSNATVKALTEQLERSENRNQSVPDPLPDPIIQKLRKQNAKLKSQLQTQDQRIKNIRNQKNSYTKLIKNSQMTVTDLGKRLTNAENELRKFQKICSPKFANVLYMYNMTPSVLYQQILEDLPERNENE